MRHLRATGAVAPEPPERMLYVDALATDPAHRRSGVASALLADADRMAAAAGLDGVALDTGLENLGARALYERAGFTPTSLRPGARRADRARARRLGLRRLRQAPSRPLRASATRATWPSVICGKNGSASDAAATRSQTGNSPGRWPKRSR